MVSKVCSHVKLLYSLSSKFSFCLIKGEVLWLKWNVGEGSGQFSICFLRYSKELLISKVFLAVIVYDYVWSKELQTVIGIILLNLFQTTFKEKYL